METSWVPWMPVGIGVFAVGALVAAVLLRGLGRSGEGSALVAELRARLEERSARAAVLEHEVALRARELAALAAARERLAAELDHERRAAAEKIALLGDAETRLRETFASLSAEALQHNNRSFLDLAKTSFGEFQKTAVTDLDHRQLQFDALVRPVRESLERVDQKVAAVERDRIGAYAALSEQVRSLATTQQQLHSETSRLVQALRTPAVRGRWGEIQLRRVVELAGMLDRCDFFEQESVTTEDGRLRPDLLVKLPGGKNIIVDAKAPLGAYLDSYEATDEATREAKLRDHSRQVRDHMTKLSAKGYFAQFEPAPEFVVMFLPGETFFGAALQYDPELIEFGVDKRVILASPTTLIALLRAVAYGWRQERLAENAQAISDLGQELYGRLRTLAGHFDKLGGHLDRALSTYNEAVGSFERSVLVAARRFKDKGVGGGEEIPLLDAIDRTARVLQRPADEADDEKA